MTHYLIRLYNNPDVDDPVEEAPAIHKHFTRYSKGEFDGPVIKVRQNSSRISVWCSYEYEDLALRFALMNLPDDKVEVKGNIISGIDFTPLIKKIGLGEEWYPEESSGKTKNFTTKLKTGTKVDKNKLKELIEKGEPYLYFLMNINNKDADVKLSTKSKPPRPSSKSPDKASPSSKVKFCSVKVPNTEENMEWLMNEAFIDFQDEIPDDWKLLILQNNYEITDLEFPKRDKKISSRQFRLNTLRKGEIKRILEIDKEPVTKSFAFKA